MPCPKYLVSIFGDAKMQYMYNKLHMKYILTRHVFIWIIVFVLRAK